MAQPSATGSSPRAPTVADRLHGARRRHFVGRGAELELIRDALATLEAPFAVVWVHGPGGVGKTTLLRALADETAAHGREPILVDLRSTEPTPPAFAAAVARAGESDPRAPAEDWLREELLPALPAGALTVVAGRRPPGGGWRRDPGWAHELRVVALRNLGPDDASALLRRTGVAERHHDAVLAATHGHPLALTLLLDLFAQRGDATDEPPPDLRAVPDVVANLVESFVDEVPTAQHRTAVHVVAHARTTTVATLRRAIGDELADELFAWLRGLSFVEVGPHGLLPHDLARDVLEADLRWRDTETFVQLHRRIRDEVVARLRSTDGVELQRALADLMFLHRGNPITPQAWDWSTLGHVYADALREGDAAAILAMVRRHEGVASAAIAARWLERQPAAFTPFRAHGPEPVGFLAQLALHEADPDDVAADPVARAAWEHAQRQSPPRPQDEVLIGRFFMDREAYQAPSPSFNVLTIRTTQEWLRRPRLSWYYMVFADPEAFGPLMAYIHFARAPEADAEVGGHRLGAFARDWRRSPADEWLELMAERELSSQAPAPAAAAPEELALSERAFAEAVRAALRDLRRPDALAANPLLRTRTVRERCGDDPVAALRDLIVEAVDALAAEPRDAKLARALQRTYVTPAATQEAAAELLGLPFSTYRGHLARGIERVAERLWHCELYGPSVGGP